MFHIRVLDDPRQNTKIRRLLQPLRWVIGRRLFARLFRWLPVRGRVNVRLPEGQTVTFYAGVDDEITSRLYFRGYEGYEHETLEIYRQLCKRSKVIFDIGANVGVFTLVAAVTSPNALIYSFEPVERVFRILEKNVRRNRVKNVRLRLAAVTEFDGKTKLFVPVGNTPQGARTTRLKREKYRRRPEMTRVRAIQGDVLVRAKNLSRLDLVKVDTETTEPQVLQGLRESIERFKPVIICEVLHGKTEKALMEFLQPLGYRYFQITDQGLVETDVIEGDPSYRFRNYLFSAEPIALEDSPHFATCKKAHAGSS